MSTYHEQWVLQYIPTNKSQIAIATSLYDQNQERKGTINE